MMDRPELMHGIGLTTDILATVERTLGLPVPSVRICPLAIASMITCSCGA